MPAPVYESVSSNTGSAASLTLNKPSGTVEGDLLLAWCVSTAANWLAETGWNNELSDRTMFYWKIAGASEPSSYTFDNSSSGGVAGAMIRVSSPNATTPLTAHPTPVSGVNPPASGTVDNDDYLAVAAVGARAASTAVVPISPPTNYTERADEGSNTGLAYCGMSIATRDLTGITSEDPGAFTVNAANAGSASWTLLLGPAGPTTVYVAPDADLATTGWSATPLWSKVDDDPDSPDGTTITASVT